MSTICIPVSVYSEIENLTRSFIWGSASQSRKAALVSWENYCRPIKYGGLGLRSLITQNKIFLMKLGFQILTNTEAPWDNY